MKDHKKATFQHTVSDQNLTCCSQPFLKPRESTIEKMDLWKGKMDTNCEKQKKPAGERQERKYTSRPVSLCSFKEEQSGKKKGR